jgi:hypothetical protein
VSPGDRHPHAEEKDFLGVDSFRAAEQRLKSEPDEEER